MEIENIKWWRDCLPPLNAFVARLRYWSEVKPPSQVGMEPFNLFLSKPSISKFLRDASSLGIEPINTNVSKSIYISVEDGLGLGNVPYNTCKK